MANVDVWNGCSETVICNVKTQVANVQADAIDNVHGHCFSLVRH
jgi:hypothetical protein